MDYYIIPEEEVDCQNDFPNGLSFFFEQVGGYGKYAEVSQVSRILQIDLSLFQEISYDDEDYSEPVDEDDEMPAASPIIWHGTAVIILVIDRWLAKIAAFPNYYEQVLHNPNRKQELDSLIQLTASGNEEKIKRGLGTLHKEPLFNYPADYGYLSSGQIVEDLKSLRKTLMCYEEKGVTRVKLMYM